MSPTKEELYEQAAALDIEGRSSMTKDELEQAIKAAGGSTVPEADIPWTSGAAGHAEHEMEQALRGRPNGLRRKEG